VNGWQELVSNIVTSAIWPLVVLILGITFRETLRSVLQRVKGFEGLGAKLEFDETLRRIDVEADSLQIEAQRDAAEISTESPKAPTIPPGAPEASPESEYKSDPRGDDKPLLFPKLVTPAQRIVYAWERVERQLFEAWILESSRRAARGEPFRTPTETHTLVNYLLRWRMVGSSEHALLFDLRTTRDSVVHDSVEPSEAQALAYEQAAESMRDALGRAVQKLKMLPQKSLEAE
jgi:hypothetical protein